MEPTSLDQPSAFRETSLPHPGGNLALAIVAGVAAALVAALLWALAVSLTHVKIGFGAVGVGFLVGWTVRAAGRGHSPIYGYAAAVLALLGCVVGDVLTDCVAVAEHLGQPTWQVVSHLTPGNALDLLQAGFQPLDALFYVLALMAGYRNAFSRV